MHYWLLLNRDVRKPIGGVKQMHRLAEALTACGRSATIIQEDDLFHPSWFNSSVDTVSYEVWIDRFKGVGGILIKNDNRHYRGIFRN